MPWVPDAVSFAALLILLAGSLRMPAPRTEASLAAVALGLVLVAGTGPGEVAAAVRELAPILVFLVAILIVADLSDRSGLFTAIGSRLGSRPSPLSLFRWSFASAAAVTVVLSLDATVVLLTPVVLVAAATGRHGGRQFAGTLALTCGRLANSASLLLPVSNLTTLLVWPLTDLSFVQFALLIAPSWAIALAADYFALRHRLGSDAAAPEPSPAAPVGPQPLPRATTAVIGLMLTGFVVGSMIDLDPAWVAAAAALVLSAIARRRRQARAVDLLRASGPSFIAFVIALSVVVEAIGRGPVGTRLASVIPDGDGLLALLAIAALGAVLAALLNNIPATLLLAPLVLANGDLALMALLIGINLGSAMTWTGSLANLLWRRAVHAAGGPVDHAGFWRLGLLVTPVTIAAAVAALAGWSRLIDPLL